MSGIRTIEDSPLPASFRDEAQLEEFLSTPTRGLITDLARLDGDITVLGVAGKVGPTLAMMAKRAAPGKRVIGVARFSDPDVKRRLEVAGVETIACDLLDRAAIAKLPVTPNVVFMAGKKFGTTGGEPFTWAMNAACRLTSANGSNAPGSWRSRRCAFIRSRRSRDRARRPTTRRRRRWANTPRTAWHNDCHEVRQLFGPAVIGLDQMIRWNADWLQRGLPLHHKPTHYEERGGAF